MNNLIFILIMGLVIYLIALFLTKGNSAVPILGVTLGAAIMTFCGVKMWEEVFLPPQKNITQPAVANKNVCQRAAVGNIVAIGPRYLTIETTTGKLVPLSHVTNLDEWREISKKFMDRHKEVNATYWERYSDTGEVTDTTIEMIIFTVPQERGQ